MGTEFRSYAYWVVKDKSKSIRLLKKTIFEKYFVDQLEINSLTFTFLCRWIPTNVYIGEHQRSTGDTAEKMHQVCKYKIREDYDSETDSNDRGEAYKAEKNIYFSFWCNSLWRQRYRIFVSLCHIKVVPPSSTFASFLVSSGFTVVENEDMV